MSSSPLRLLLFARALSNTTWKVASQTEGLTSAFSGWISKLGDLESPAEQNSQHNSPSEIWAMEQEQQRAVEFQLNEPTTYFILEF